MNYDEEKHYKAARCLALGWAKVQVAKHLGIAERTLRNWNDDPDFLRLVAQVQSELGTARASALTPLVVQAAESVSTAMNSLIAGLGDDTPALRSNLKALVDTLETLIRLEREDGGSKLVMNMKGGGLNAKNEQPIPPLRPAYQEVPDIGLRAAADAPPPEIRRKES